MDAVDDVDVDESVTYVGKGETLRFADESEFEDWLLDNGSDAEVTTWYSLVEERSGAESSGLVSLPDDHPDVLAYLTALEEKQSDDLRLFGGLWDNHTCTGNVMHVMSVPANLSWGKRNRASCVKSAGVVRVLCDRKWWKGRKVVIGISITLDLDILDFNNRTDSTFGI
ncbi:MAG: hypothetical protein V3V08_21305 [Nannocystaceae bacterium]